MAAYTELQVGSDYSFLRGASRIEELTRLAKALLIFELGQTVTWMARVGLPFWQGGELPIPRPVPPAPRSVPPHESRVSAAA